MIYARFGLKKYTQSYIILTKIYTVKTLITNHLKLIIELKNHQILILILIIAGLLSSKSAFINQNKKYFRIIFI